MGDSKFGIEPNTKFKDVPEE
ncbi:hypothetical protein [Flagellimonas abyssi]